jgi:prepilin-type N-terminal cleavage/methylation domain-containing protein
MNEYIEDRNEQGFTLIELLIAIVVVGILTAVAIVGIAGLTNNGSKSACAATKDAVTAAQAVFYSNHNGTYPTSFNDLLTDTPNPELTLSGGTTHAPLVAPFAGDTISGSGWTLTSGAGGAVPMTVASSGTGAC